MNQAFKYTIIAWLLVALTTIKGTAQIQLVLQSGHTGDIVCVATSPSGKYFATSGTDNTIKLWDAETGTVLRNLTAHKTEVRNMAFSDDDFYLISVSVDKVALIWRVETNPDNKILDPSTTYNKAVQDKFTLNYNNYTEFTGAHQELPGGYLKAYKGIQSTPKALVFGHQKYFLGVSDEVGNYTYWDATISKPASSIKFKNGPSVKMLALPKDKKILTLDGNMLTLRKITGEPLEEKDLGVSGKDVLLLDEGKQAAVLDQNGHVQIFNINKLEWVNTLKEYSVDQISAGMNSTDLFLYSQSGKKIYCYSFVSQSIKWLVQDVESLRTFTYAACELLVASNHNNEIITFSARSGNELYRRAPNVPFDQIQWSTEWRFVVCANQKKNYVQITDIFHGNTFLIYPERKIVPDKLAVSVHYTSVSLEDGSCNIYDSENGYLIINTSADLSEKMLREDDDRTAMVIVEPVIDRMDERAVVTRQNRSIFPAVFSPDGQLICTVNSDYEVELYNWKEKKRFRLLISPLGTILLSPQNKYFESGNGHELVRFVTQENVYSFEQFDLHFNRPDKVLTDLGYPPASIAEVYNKAYNLRLKRLGYKNSRTGNSFHVPKIEIVGVKDLPFETTEKSIVLKINASDTKNKLESIAVKINGSLIREIDLKGKGLMAYEENIDVYLTGGDNKIEVVSRNDLGALSIAATYFIKRIGEIPRPDLYIMTIGASSFANKAMDLNYARKDASDVSGAFKNKENMFGKVHEFKLFDQEVTLEKIRETIGKIKACSPDDYFYFFIASHGILDENFELYLATHDIDFTNPKERGLSYQEIENMMLEVPSRHKILIMDACHSGELDKSTVKKVISNSKSETGEVVFRSGSGTGVESSEDMNYLDLMKSIFNEMKKSSGATIISSAGGTEYAMEGEKWKNGVFTYCMLNGLLDGEADLDKDGTVLLSELNQFLIRKVPELTSGNQKPTSRTINTKNDIKIWY